MYRLVRLESSLARALKSLPATMLRSPSRYVRFALSAGGVAGATALCTSQQFLAAQCEDTTAPAAGFLKATFIADAAAKASPSLVNIRVRNGFQESSGSGFIVDSKGLVLTNTHVVKDAMSRFGGGAVSVTLSDGERVQGIVQHADPISDIAVVRLQTSRQLPEVKLGSSAALRVGEFVVALGAPAGLANSVSSGIVSSVDRTRSDLGLDRFGGQSSRANGYLPQA